MKVENIKFAMVIFVILIIALTTCVVATTTYLNERNFALYGYATLSILVAIVMGKRLKPIHDWICRSLFVYPFLLLVILLGIISWYGYGVGATSTDILTGSSYWFLTDSGQITLRIPQLNYVDAIRTIFLSSRALAAQISILLESYDYYQGINRFPIFLQVFLLSLGLAWLTSVSIMGTALLLWYEIWQGIQALKKRVPRKIAEITMKVAYFVIILMHSRQTQRFLRTLFVVVVLVIVILDGIGLAFTSKPIPVQWETIVTRGLPTGKLPMITSFATSANQRSTWVGTWGFGVFLSHDNGQTWQPTNDGLTDHHVNALIIDPNTDRIFAGTHANGIFVLNDDLVWQSINDGLPASEISCLIINTKGQLFAGTADQGIFFYSEDSRSWKSVTGVPSARVRTLAMGPDSKALFAGTSKGTFYSVDEGLSWKSVKIGLQNWIVWAFTVGTDGHTLFAGTDGGGLFLSRDLGITWQHIDSEVLGQHVISLISDLERDIIVAGTVNGVFYSHDGGNSWLPANNGLEEAPVWALQAGVDGDRIYAGTSAGGWFSDDFTMDWQPLKGDWTRLQVFTIVQDENSADGLFAGTSGGVFFLEGMDKEWVPRNEGLTNPFTWSLVSGKNGLLLAGTSEGLFRSENGGIAWQKVELEGDESIVWALVSYTLHDQTKGIAARTTNGLYYSIDLGRTWQRNVNGLTSFDVKSFLIAPENGIFLLGLNHVILPLGQFSGENWLSGQATFGIRHRVLSSEDMGGLWNRVNDEQIEEVLQDFAVTPGTGIVYAAAYDGSLYSSSDGGKNWGEVKTDSIPKMINDLYICDSALMYAATDGDGVFQSSDGGITWTSFNQGLSNLVVSSILTNKNGDLVASTFGGVFWYSEEEKRWKALNYGLSEVENLNLVEADGEMLWAQIEDRGIYQSNDEGHSWRPSPDRTASPTQDVISSRIQSLVFDTQYEPQIVAINGNLATLYASTGASLLLRAEISLPPLVQHAPLPYLKFISWTRSALHNMVTSWILAGFLIIILEYIVLTYSRTVRSNRLPLRMIMWLLVHPSLSANGYQRFKKEWLDSNALERLIIIVESDTNMFPIDHLEFQLNKIGAIHSDSQLQNAINMLMQRNIVEAGIYELIDPMTSPSVFSALKNLQFLARYDPRTPKQVFLDLRSHGIPELNSSFFAWINPALPRILAKELVADEKMRLAEQVRQEHPLYARTREFLSQANFHFEELGTDAFIIKPQGPAHPQAEYGVLYTRLIARRAPTGDDFTAVCESAHTHYGNDLTHRVVLVISDQRPEPGARYRLYEIRQREGLAIVPLDVTLFGQIKPDRTANDILTTEIDQATGQQNLYAISGPVSGDLSFFGRERVLQEIIDLLDAGQPVGLFGLRKMGKTSLIQRLQGRLAQRRPLALVDTQKTTQQQGVWPLYPDIIAAFADHVQRHRPNIVLPKLLLWPEAPTPTPALADAFVQDVQALHAALGAPEKSERLLLIVDEIDRLLPVGTSPGYAGFAALFGQLRALNQHAQLLDFLVVGVDAAVNRVERWADHDNELYLALREVWMPPMAADDVREMIESLGFQMGVRYEADALHWLAECGGGQPFVTRQMCSRAVAERLGRGAITVTLAQAQQAVEDFIYDSPYLPELWRTRLDDPQREMLRALARAAEPLSRVALLPAAQRQAALASLVALEDYTLIRREDGHYTLAWDVFCRWIRWIELGLEA